MRIARLVFAAWTAGVAAASTDGFAAGHESVVTLKTRGEVAQSFLLTPADGPPKAAVVLFPGGDGKVNLARIQNVNWKRGNFLVRTRHLFAARGLLAATVDAPSDRQGDDGMEGGFRSSAEHAADVAAVIRHLKTVADVPVWLVGTSRGTESAASVGIKIQEKIAGIVLTSTMTMNNKKGENVLAMALDRIVVPALVVAHTGDGCAWTPAHNTDRLARSLANARRKQALFFEGGDAPQSGPCDALSEHGFFGIERQVVDAIAAFITAE